ncbi:hypothetical protein ACQP2T_20220 [Nonomuraea sp. CA-143628]|uniref:hypothetical protein n=1 Tax=Nonomuraea sp. CA-143628 TaxID=3239997 RepID=UPI003D8EDD80
MSHRIELAPAALAKLANFPDEAMTALVERSAHLVDAPWDAFPVYPDRTDFRETTFGAFGIMRFVVDDDQELIRVTRSCGPDDSELWKRLRTSHRTDLGSRNALTPPGSGIGPCRHPCGGPLRP